jgi:hypothetical protein
MQYHQFDHYTVYRIGEKMRSGFVQKAKQELFVQIKITTIPKAYTVTLNKPAEC